MRFSYRLLATLLGALTLVVAGCGSDGGTDAEAGGESGGDAGRPTIVVTTNILGDVVENLTGDAFNVVTIMPVGADPHDFQASAQQVAEIGDADALIVNGAEFEESLLDVIEAAEDDGVPVFEAISAVETIDFSEGEHADEHEDDEAHEDEAHEDDEHEDDEHEDDEHEDEAHEDHGHEGVDPHFFTDPARMAVAADAIAEFLATNVDAADADTLRADAEAYIDELEALDGEVAETLAVIDDERRVLVTNHEVFGYFAERYDFEVVGTVVPSGATTDGVSAQELADLAEVLEHEGVAAIFADTSSSDELAQTLAGEMGGEVEVVELFSESLGAADTDGGSYLDMVRTNAQRIVGALAG